MNTQTIEKLQELAPAIERFRNLSPREQEWMAPLLAPIVKSALNILDCIEEQELSYLEIANTCGMHPTSISQILNALADGGCSISFRSKAAFAPIGRSRTLIKR